MFKPEIRFIFSSCRMYGIFTIKLWTCFFFLDILFVAVEHTVRMYNFFFFLVFFIGGGSKCYLFVGLYSLTISTIKWLWMNSDRHQTTLSVLFLDNRFQLRTFYTAHAYRFCYGALGVSSLTVVIRACTSLYVLMMKRAYSDTIIFFLR